MRSIQADQYCHIQQAIKQTPKAGMHNIELAGHTQPTETCCAAHDFWKQYLF
jgi:hypothetical protein